MSDALLLVAHGTRSRQGAAECLGLAEEVRRLRPGLPVAVGNLELCAPSIADSFDALVEAGARRIAAVPLLLFTARHAKQDIPDALDAQRRRHPTVDVAYGAPLGIQPALLDLVGRRVADASGGQPPSRTAVALVRAGSTDPDARADIEAAARALAARHRYLAVEPAFAGIAEPSIESALERCRRPGAEQIAAVPYLLFSGELAERVRGHALTFASACPGTAVVTTGHIGPDPVVASLVLERYAETLGGKPGN